VICSAICVWLCLFRHHFIYLDRFKRGAKGLLIQWRHEMYTWISWRNCTSHALRYPKTKLECSWLVHFQIPNSPYFPAPHGAHDDFPAPNVDKPQLNKHINRWQWADAKNPSVGSTMFNCLTTTGEITNVKFHGSNMFPAPIPHTVSSVSFRHQIPRNPGQCFLKLSKATNSKPLKPQTLESQHP